MITRTSHLPLISISKQMQCKLNKNAAKLLNAKGGQFYLLITIPEGLALQKTVRADAHEVKYYFSNDTYFIGRIDLARELTKLFPGNNRKFVLKLETVQSGEEYFTIKSINQ